MKKVGLRAAIMKKPLPQKVIDKKPDRWATPVSYPAEAPKKKGLYP